MDEQKPISRQELETYLKLALQMCRDDLKNFTGPNMADFLKGRYEECRIICQHFGIEA